MLRIERIAKAAALAACGLAGGLTLTWAAFQLTRPWPLEYREGAVVLTTARWLEGYNPWSLEQQPVFVNVYGFVYHLLAYPLARLFGATFLVHRALSLAFLLAGAAALVWALRRERVSWGFAGMAGSLLLAFQCTDSSILARPDALGFTLFFLSLALPWSRAFDTRSLALAGGLAVLGFFTKPYFLLGVPLVALYLLLFRSARRAFAYGFAVLAALVVAGLVVNAVFPAYFTNTFFIHVNANTTNLAHLKHYLAAFGWETAGVFAMALVVLVEHLVARRRGVAVATPGTRLARWDPGLPAFAFAVDLVLMVGRMGQHVGNGILYYHQILTPLLLWAVFRRAQPAGRSALPAALGALGAGVFALVDLAPLPPDMSREWQSLENLVRTTPRLVAPPPLAVLVHSMGKPLYDNGQTEYCLSGGRLNPLASAAEYERRCLALRDHVLAGIRAQSFDAVVVVPQQSPMVDRKVLGTFYRLRFQTRVPMTFESFWAEVWVPKREATPVDRAQ